MITKLNITMKQRILVKTVLWTISFVIGYLSYKTIPDAVALSCDDGSIIYMEIDTVFSEQEVSAEKQQAEEGKWSSTAKIRDGYFVGNENLNFEFK